MHSVVRYLIFMLEVGVELAAQNGQEQFCVIYDRSNHVNNERACLAKLGRDRGSGSSNKQRKRMKKQGGGDDAAGEDRGGQSSMRSFTSMSDQHKDSNKDQDKDKDKDKQKDKQKDKDKNDDTDKDKDSSSSTRAKYKLFKELVHVLEDCFAERLGALFILDAGFVFWMSYKLVSPALSKTTR